MKTHLGNVQSCYDRGHVKLIISPFALLFSTAYSLYQILIVILIFFRNPPPPFYCKIVKVSSLILDCAIFFSFINSNYLLGKGVFYNIQLDQPRKHA